MNHTQIEYLLRGLLNGKHASLSIGFNEDHAANYQTAAEFDADMSGWYSKEMSWVSEEDRRVALADNTVWTAQWYPNSPVGSYKVAAATLSALLAFIATHFGACDTGAFKKGDRVKVNMARTGDGTVVGPDPEDATRTLVSLDFNKDNGHVSHVLTSLLTPLPSEANHEQA